jgi:hypothetical protein
MSGALIEKLAGVVMSSHHDQNTCITKCCFKAVGNPRQFKVKILF